MELNIFTKSDNLFTGIDYIHHQKIKQQIINSFGCCCFFYLFLFWILKEKGSFQNCSLCEILFGKAFFFVVVFISFVFMSFAVCVCVNKLIKLRKPFFWVRFFQVIDYRVSQPIQWLIRSNHNQRSNDWRINKIVICISSICDLISLLFFIIFIYAALRYGRGLNVVTLHSCPYVSHLNWCPMN